MKVRFIMPGQEQSNALQAMGAAQVVAGAELTMAAKKVVYLYKVCAVKISNLTGAPCDFGEEKLIIAPNATAARMQYMRGFMSDKTDDIVGNWAVSALKTMHGRGGSLSDTD
jgi:hypothetical protein